MSKRCTRATPAGKVKGRSYVPRASRKEFLASDIRFARFCAMFYPWFSFPNTCANVEKVCGEFKVYDYARYPNSFRQTNRFFERRRREVAPRYQIRWGVRTKAP